MRFPSFRRPKPAAPQSEPNITPLIDVLLVLLILFLAALPLSQEGIDMSLPPVQEKPAPEKGSTHIVLEYSADRKLTINQSPVRLEDLEGRLRAIFQARRDKTLFVSGAPTLRYGEIVTVVDAAKGAGVERVGVITPGLKEGR